MPKITTLLIISAYIIYFILTPPLTIHDESSHVDIIVALSQGHYPYTGKNDKENKQLGANQKLQDALKYVDHPDQIPTFNTVSQLKEEKNDYNIKNIFSHEAYSPPFYYFVGTIFYYLSKITPYLLGQFYIMRLTSTLFYVGAVIIVWKILLKFFKNKKIASSILIFFSLNPLVLKMGIGINPDIGGTFFSLCVLYFLLKFSPKILKTKHIITISFISALAAMTKISGVFTNAVFVFYIFVVHGVRKKTLGAVVLFQSIFLSLTLPWFIFAFNRYNTFFPEPFSINCIKLGHESFFIKFIETFTIFRFTIMNYAGFMGEGWPHPFKWFFVSYVVLFVILLIFGLFVVIRQKKLIYKTTFIYILPLFLFLTMLSAQYKIKEIDCDISGRYLLSGFFVLCFFVYWGVFYFSKDEKKAAKIILGFAIFHYLFVLFTVLLIRYHV